MTEEKTMVLSSLMNTVSIQQQTNELLACNKVTASYGLTLTRQQAAALITTRTEVLKSTGRIEFSGGIAGDLVLAFCDSPYISQENYEDTLHQLIELFYSFKNETSDQVSDADLIEYMKNAFNGPCSGSMELLADRELPALAQKTNNNRFTDIIKEMEITDE